MSVAVLGGGAWGTALALTALRGGHATTFWMRDAEAVAAVNRRHENPGYLPGVALDPGLVATSDLDGALAGASCVLAVAPAQALRGLAGQIAGRIAPGVPIVVCAKGIESGTGKRLSDIVRAVLPGHPPAALSGPSFAADVARGLPTAVTVAADGAGLAAELARTLSAPQFRCYSTDDLVGVEIGGALKNVLAIAAGAVAGAGLGASAQAAIVTRGFVELRRLGASFGARPETLMGLSGLGDLVLTCSSAQSRNFAYGMALGRGGPVSGLRLAEGVATAGIAAALAADRGIDAPITAAVDRLLCGTLSIGQAIEDLLSRPLKAEDE
jgi:glycerol-3-phosphate dehydrogenase (NAD(P)+)